MTAGLLYPELWPLLDCIRCGEPKCPRRRNSKKKPVCKDCAGPVVMSVKLPKPVPGSPRLRTVVIHLGARTTKQAIKTLRFRDGITVTVSGQMHQLRIASPWDAVTRHFVLETLLNANSNALAPGGWSWKLSERVKNTNSEVTTRVQLFEAPPKTELSSRYADPGLFFDKI